MIARDDGMIGIHFMRLGMLALALGLFFGVIGSFQFLFPEFLEELNRENLLLVTHYQFCLWLLLLNILRHYRLFYLLQ